MKLRVKKLYAHAVMPIYAKPGDAGADIVATSKTSVYDIHGSLKYIEYGTGLSFEIPEGYEGEVRPRSSISETCLMLSNSPGTIDSGYRGEVKARFKVLGQGREYEIGDKIFQLLIKPALQFSFEEVKELSITERGDGGFGSSGK